MGVVREAWEQVAAAKSVTPPPPHSSGWRSSEAAGSAAAVAAIVTVAGLDLPPTVRAVAVVSIAAVSVAYSISRAVVKLTAPLASFVALLWSFRRPPSSAGTSPSTPPPSRPSQEQRQ